MRHRMRGSRRFGRRPDERASMMKNLVLSLVQHERITTTAAKAAELRPVVEKLITLSTKDTPYHRQLVEFRLRDRKTVTKLFDDLGPRMSGRPGGYTRTYKLGARQGDGAEMVQIQIVE